jgi:hypothetical protein
MPDPQRLLKTLRQAETAFRQTPGRQGRVVTLTDAKDVLVVGDLHGNLGNFQSSLKLADLATNLQRHLVLQEVIHGSGRYPGGGDKSHQLLDLVAALKCQFPQRVHFIPGNHELAQATNRAVAKDFVDNNAIFVDGIREAYGESAEVVYAAYLSMIAAAPLVVRTPNRVFISHSLPSALKLARFRIDDLLRETEPADLETTGSAYSISWGRDTRAEHVAAFLKTVDADWLVTGHIPCDNGFWAPNDRQVVLDAMRSPGGYCLFPANRPLTHSELLACCGTL